MSTELTIAEQKRRDVLEREIDVAMKRGREAALTIGRCFAEILETRLYRDDYVRFEDYAKDFWGVSESLARRWADASRIAKNLAGDDARESDVLFWGSLEGFRTDHARVLKPLPPAAQKATWEAAKAASPTPTAAMLSEVAKRFKPEAARIATMTTAEEIDYLSRREKATNEAIVTTRVIESVRLARVALGKAIQALSHEKLGDMFQKAPNVVKVDGGFVDALKAIRDGLDRTSVNASSPPMSCSSVPLSQK